MALKWIDLFEGLMKESIPFDENGYIVRVTFDRQSSNYAVIEMIAFKNVKNVAISDRSVTFYSDGYKIFVAYEPVTYRFRYQEPYLRDGIYQFPARFNEVETIELPKHDKIFVSQKPYISQGSFNLNRPATGDLAYYIYYNARVEAHIFQFIDSILTDDLGITKSVLPEVNKYIKQNLEYFYKSEGTEGT
jgi:hypothetical protein